MRQPSSETTLSCGTKQAANRGFIDRPCISFFSGAIRTVSCLTPPTVIVGI